MKRFDRSGVLIGERGHVLTNRHVVDPGCSDVFVEDFQGQVVKAQIVEMDPVLDVALLKTTWGARIRGRAPVAIRATDDLKVGDALHLAGFLGGELALRGGLIHSLADPIHGNFGFTVGVATYYGGSGGPILNDDGHLVGIVWGKLNTDARLHAYALKMQSVQPFLIKSGADWRSAFSPLHFEMPLSDNAKVRREEVAGIAIRATVKVRCSR